MKRTQLIEWGIIVIALIFGYKFFEGTITIITQVIFTSGDTIDVPFAFKTVLIIAIYVIAFLVLIKNSRRIAEQLGGAANSPENDLAIKIGKQSLLQVILIGICGVTILSNLADIILYVFNAFKKEVGRTIEPDENYFVPGRYLITVKAIQIVLAIIVISASRNISRLLIRKDEAEELVFDSKPEN